MATSRETSSSTGVVFAKAKSEWVIPQRAKPGRKSSKAVLETQQQQQQQQQQQPVKQPFPASSGSRDAQRAFRERKSEYVASLEARIEAFEKGEVQRNVALQSTARAMKEENIKIKTELLSVKRELMMVEKDGSVKGELIRALESALAEMRGRLSRAERRASEAERKGNEAFEAKCGSCESRPRPVPPISPSTQGSGRITSTSPSQSSLLSALIPQYQSPVQESTTSFRSPTNRDTDADAISRQVAMDMACGFCEGIESVCVCRIVRENELSSSSAHSHNQQSERPFIGINPVTKQLTPTYHAELTAAVKSTSILDNLPPIEPAVPLRRRRERGGVSGIRKAPIFAVSPAAMQGANAQSPLYIPPAECSGDPRNCPACKDDAFGREFCESLSKSMCNNEPGHRCENCPGEKTIGSSRPQAVRSASGRSESSATGDNSSPSAIEAKYLDIKCCGDKKLCGTVDEHCDDDPHDHDHWHDSARAADHSIPPTGTWEERISQLAPHGHEVDVTLSADEAWKTLKAHPNAKFASLAMLADVVARGTKCLGQPATPTPPTLPDKPFTFTMEPRLPSAQESVNAGNKRRRFEVHSYAVKEALAVLDAHPGHVMKKRRLSDIRGT